MGQLELGRTPNGIYDLAGKRIGTTQAGEVAALDVAYEVPLGKHGATVLVAIDTTSNSLRTQEPVPVKTITTENADEFLHP